MVLHCWRLRSCTRAWRAQRGHAWPATSGSFLQPRGTATACTAAVCAAMTAYARTTTISEGVGRIENGPSAGTGARCRKHKHAHADATSASRHKHQLVQGCILAEHARERRSLSRRWRSRSCDAHAVLLATAGINISQPGSRERQISRPMAVRCTRVAATGMAKADGASTCCGACALRAM